MCIECRRQEIKQCLLGWYSGDLPGLVPRPAPGARQRSSGTAFQPTVALLMGASTTATPAKRTLAARIATPQGESSIARPTNDNAASMPIIRGQL